MAKKLSPKGQAAPPVEPNIASASIPRKAAPKRQPLPKKVAKDTKYVRNLHNITARIRLESGRAIELAPRGQREDIDVISLAEREDPKYLLNLDLIFEEIEPEAAQEIIAKQQHNFRRQKHSLAEHMRNAKGEEYAPGTVQNRVVDAHPSQVVGYVDPAPATAHTDQNKEVRRAGPNFTSAPGSPGHPATDYMLSDEPDFGEQEYQEFLEWKRFREAQKRAAETEE